MKHQNIAIPELSEAVMRLPVDSLTESRNSALSRLKERGLPTVRHEDWKYTDLTAPIQISKNWIAAGAINAVIESSHESIAKILSSIDAHWLVIANGKVDASRLANIAGFDFELFSDSSAAAITASPLADLNAALLTDGARIQIHSATEKPLGLLVFDSAESQSTVCQAGVALEIAAGCDAEIIEYHASCGDQESYCNSSISMQVGESAKISHVRIQDRQLGHAHTAGLSISMGTDSELTMAGYDLGGGLIRNDLHIDLGEPDAKVSFNGLYLAGDGQHIDNHTRVDHRVGPASSFQEYRGILNGKCRCVWNGKAVVHKGADGTDANQANHNLLLSDQAEIDAKPELEIYADEVKCSHGTTVGQLDENALYYLRTRGLGKQQARQVLTNAFAADLVSRTPIASTQAVISELVNARLDLLLQDGLL